MKKCLVFFMILGITITAASFIHADVYIKQKSHTDGYYYGGINRPAVDSTNELWLGDGKIVLITETSITIIDKEKNHALIINKSAKTYVETTLPIDLSKLGPERVAPVIKAIRYRGRVKETGKTKTIGKQKCKEYAINTYGVYQGNRDNELDTTLWASSDLPFDMNKYRDLLFNIYRLRNYSDELLEEMKKIDGFRIAAESLYYPKGFSVKTTTEVTEISQKEPPPGIYSVPQGFTKKEKFTIPELRRLLG
ncbi:MAG: DUF4412 domain-containing protein [Candidatus Aminicenantes bacterium]|nr:DUF4412 domain-containing protein [Candidatus Aminicenantes bacterium]NIM81125.1 DUF4412 domain-containing protein [Candidatus Aminicenantes bacterium]NIN20499.1 DUF4412 domain-containing protein [Candidatus Aminicenantes bacterium]NIN44272.1 DUF4412 domain-containing protein [Candidatus Aminicenantes bacterium]NIN87091.1 DUF4412 domain-containing protein [Candidatus Aminicenantes bacterium]